MKDSHREIRIYKIRLKSLLVVLLSYCFVIFMEPGYTWSQGGHKIVNYVAWLQLNPEMRTEAIELIREHVRFEEDFVDEMPTSVTTGSQELKDQWVFLQAGAWPDIARDLPSFHHSTWHYVNFPHVLKPEDRAEL